MAASYTWSKFIDSTSEAVGGNDVQAPASGNLTSIPVSQGGLTVDRGLSNFDRRRRLTIAYVWTVPGPRLGWRKHIMAGWSVTGITIFQSGTPFTVANNFDRKTAMDSWKTGRTSAIRTRH